VWGGGLCYLSKMKYGVTDSDSVRNLQHRLISLGYSIPAGVTGNYASQTDLAVRQHQAAACPPADPVGASYVGPKQASILFGYPGSPYRVV
jgi:peptidoglycan hydrolase-like protein with peptidoglycan-binding domain